MSKRAGVLLAAVAMAAVMLAGAGVAWAEGEQALSISSSPTINNTPDDTWMTNGRVFSVIRSGDYVYVGGKFTRVRSAVTGGQSFAATNLARFHADTGVGDPTWTPDVTGEDMAVTKVYALAESNGKIWAGGRFGAVDGVARRNLAAVSPDTGAVDATIDPVVGKEINMVRAMIASDQKVYIGGSFGGVDGKSRRNLAAINPVTGEVDVAWRPKADKLVWTLAFSCDNSEVFAGGSFLNAAGSTDGALSTRQFIARFDATKGALHPWAVPPSSFQNADEVASDLAVTCERITTGFLGPNYLRSFRLDDGNTGSVAWQYTTTGEVQSATMLGPDKVIVGGHFSSLNRVKSTRLAMVNLSDGTVDPSWNVGLTGTGGTHAIGPHDLLVDENHLYVGGHFAEVHTGESVLSRTAFARFTFTP